MSDELTGYLNSGKSGTKLTDWNGKKSDWILDNVVRTFHSEFGKTSAVILLRGLTRAEAEDENLIIDPDDPYEPEHYEYAAGYWLGPDNGDLFRGEIVGFDDDGYDEAKILAISESEYWMNKDAEYEEEHPEHPDDE